MSYFLKRMLERQDGVDDLCMISSISDNAIVSQLKSRLDKNKIYTNIGDVLIAVNPYKSLPIYGPAHVKMYQSANLSDSNPHIYGLAERAYRRMVTKRQGQAVIISGESGAGKTESAKLLLHYVSSVSGSSQTAQRVKDIILDCNPLLESFGNAKTVRNDNSSRFGKYLELKFNDNGEPIGGTTSNFLLEKTRVTFQQKGERNFHIFYQMLAGAWPELMEQCRLADVREFAFLAQSGTVHAAGMDDGAGFQQVLRAMQTVNINPEEQWYIFSTLAGILHLGNVQLQGEAPAQLRRGSEYSLEMAAFLFGVEPRDLLNSINHKTITMGGRRQSVVRVPQNRDQSTQIRDALAKEMFSRIFDLIVYRVNETMYPQGFAASSIGILDIYGFEIFDNNSFEQFCINYVNEKLQQIFIDLTVRGEQQEYHNEGLPWRDVPFFDNKIVCELIEGFNPPGMMRILDDTCRSLHAVDSDKMDGKFVEKLKGSACASNPHLKIQGANYNYSANFVIKHYAGSVEYNIKEFCFKNMDNLFHSLVACMQQSQHQFIRSLWPDDVANQRQPTTSSQKIRNSAKQLIESLRRCQPHYIRCIKPNERKAPMTMDGSRCHHQVKYLGLKENVKVKKAGYSYRAPYNEFLQRFHMLMPERQLTANGPGGCKQLCQYISRKHGNEIPANEWAFGKSKLFVSSPQTIFMLEEFREERIDPRGYAERVKMHEQNEARAMQVESKATKKGCCIVM